MSARTPETQARYDHDRANGLTKNLRDEPAIREWDHWKLVENAYPHDKLNQKHMLLVLKRKPTTSHYALSVIEVSELLVKILPILDREYDHVKLNLANMRSVNDVFHLHVCEYKDEYK